MEKMMSCVFGCYLTLLNLAGHLILLECYIISYVNESVRRFVSSLHRLVRRTNLLQGEFS